MLLKNREQTQTNLKAFHSGYNSQTYLFYLEDVSVRFKNVTALQSVHLAVQPREILFVTGPSGAGKSTLFKVISQFSEQRKRTFLDLYLSGFKINERVELFGQSAFGL
jgi:ABC-type multidrug transport system ATPase subunit